MATPKGPDPTDTVAVTFWVTVLMMLTLFESLLATYAAKPFGVMATPRGSDPTDTVAVTFWLSVLMMLTVFE